ncbi:hypothetical protein H6G06_02095 [Anabaena sphaerica FACHB-251]|uniref:Uncharacterized protein n=1 Tax=Anabaena sphaerica FACHB-251 TaxID=2692883 RepID=A0A926WFR8_9NOST|nr:hypothetical protein [Anabaena sphaerica]MBD2292303.1 hypothetical protein [Anabaena sphaerica FACHB-251]
MQLVSVKTQVSILNFILLWSFATLSGFLLSLLLIEIGEKPDVGVLEAAIGGLAIALPQSYLLRQTILPLGWIISTLLGWVLITAMGVGAVGWFVLSTEFLYYRIFFGIISGGIGGLVIGLAQWWLAIPSSVSWGWSWMFLSSASWAIALSIGSVTGIFLRRLTQLFLGEIVGLAITWLVVGILTGISAYRLLR